MLLKLFAPLAVHDATTSACATEARATIANAIINFFIIVSFDFLFCFFI